MLFVLVVVVVVVVVVLEVVVVVIVVVVELVFYSLRIFLLQCILMVFHWNLSNKMSPQVSRTLLSILVDLNNVVVWMLSTRLLSMSSSPCTNPLVTVPRAPITIGITVTFILHRFFFFQFPNEVQVLIFLFAFFQFYSVINWDSEVYNSASLFFLLIIKRSGRLAEIRWSVCISKSQRSLCVSFSRRESGLC